MLPILQVLHFLACLTIGAFRTLQPSEQSSQVMPPQHPTLVLSTRTATAPPLTSSSNWDTGPQASGDPGYVSPLIDLYPDRDSDLQALYDSPAHLTLISYEDLQETPSGLKADPADSDSLHAKEQSYRETVFDIRSYMKRSFIQQLEYVCPSHQDNPWTSSRSEPTLSLSLCQRI